MDEHERAWALHKSRPVMEATVANLRKAKAIPYAIGPTYGRIGSFVVVGAGPSLATTGPHLAALQRLGLTIVTVNTALKAVAKYVTPDVVLVREVVDVSSHLDAPCGLRVLDIGAGQAVWDKALATGPCLWFVPGQQQTLELAMTLNVRPLYGGTSALTAAVALCEQWGATEIVLVGVDLALADDGAVYAEGSAFGAMRASVTEGGVIYTGNEAKQAQHASGGIAPPPDAEATTDVPGWGGATVRTTASWADQIPWLAEFAKRHRDIGLLDATGAGAHKAGWFEVPIADYVANAEARTFHLPRVVTTHADVDAALADIERQATTVASIAATVLDHDGAVVCVPGYLGGTDLVDSLAARDLILGSESGASLPARIRYAYGTAFPGAALAAREGAATPIP